VDVAGEKAGLRGVVVAAPPKEGLGTVLVFEVGGVIEGSFDGDGRDVGECFPSANDAVIITVDIHTGSWPPFADRRVTDIGSGSRTAIDSISTWTRSTCASPWRVMS